MTPTNTDAHDTDAHDTDAHDTDAHDTDAHSPDTSKPDAGVPAVDRHGADRHGDGKYGAGRYDADELGQYRSLSTLAVVAFVLGLCSLLAFASPLMQVLPLAAVATALLALKAIAASAGGLTGAKLARWALALAIFFGVAAFARLQVRDLLLQQQADRVGRRWLSLAAERRAEEMMDVMTKAAVDKLSPTDTAKEPISFFGGVLAAALLRQDPLVVGVSESKAEGEARIRLADASIVAASTPPQAVFRYVVGSVESAQRHCLMVLKRLRVSEVETIWLVDSWQLEPSPNN